MNQKQVIQIPPSIALLDLKKLRAWNKLIQVQKLQQTGYELCEGIATRRLFCEQNNTMYLHLPHIFGCDQKVH